MWTISGLAMIGEREWCFFVPSDRKHSNGGRPNRTTENCFWKATGSDRSIRSMKGPKRVIGLQKALVFYKGRAPRGCRTDWVMNEYRMPDTCPIPKGNSYFCKWKHNYEWKMAQTNISSRPSTVMYYWMSLPIDLLISALWLTNYHLSPFELIFATDFIVHKRVTIGRMMNTFVRVQKERMINSLWKSRRD